MTAAIPRELTVHGAEWTVKHLFTYPNEFIYWSIQIVMYPYMTGLVAGAFVLSSLYHVFGQKDLRDMARFSLVFSLCLLPAALLPLLFHLQQPQRGIKVMLTPHFTSAIAAFGIVFSTYAAIVLSEIWFVYRGYFIEQAAAPRLTTSTGRRWFYTLLSLGSHDVSEPALALDKKAVRVLAAIGIPVACFLHGYAGFIFGSVKANALWMSPLMPVIFIMSAVVSGIALSMLTYIAVMEWRKVRARLANGRAAATVAAIRGAELEVMAKAARYLLGFLVAAISLELLDLIFRGYTAMKSWDILREVMFRHDFFKIFVLQYGLGNVVPLALLIWPGRPRLSRLSAALALILSGVFMMRWNVVIGGQAFSLSFSGFMDYHLPIIPHSPETFKEGLGGAMVVALTPFVLFWLISKLIPFADPGGQVGVPRARPVKADQGGPVFNKGLT